MSKRATTDATDSTSPSDRTEPGAPTGVEVSPSRYAEVAHAIEAEVGRVIVGQASLVHDVMLCLLCEGHALLEGVPGLGKTMLLRTLADAVDMSFNRIQFTPDLMPADIVGTQVLEPTADGGRDFRFREGPIVANLVLADEINRATPKTQSALLEAMAERSTTVGGVTRMLPRPFLVMATQNPIEQEGTYPLPEAQLDRFMFKIHVPLPSADDLMMILFRTTGSESPSASAVTNADELAAMIALTRAVPIAEHVTRYAVELVVGSHPNSPTAPDLIKQYARFGASPRGAQALVLAAKANALLDQRPSASIDDIKVVAPSALRHRLVLGYEAIADGVDADALVAALIAAIPAPGSTVGATKVPAPNNKAGDKTGDKASSS